MWLNVAQHLNSLLGVQGEYKIVRAQEAASQYFEYVLKKSHKHNEHLMEWEKGTCETEDFVYEFGVVKSNEEIFFARTVEHYTTFESQPSDVASVIGIKEKIIVSYLSTREVSPTKYRKPIDCNTIDFRVELEDVNNIHYKIINSLVKGVDWELRLGLERAGDHTLSRTAQAVPAMLNDVLLALYSTKEEQFENSLLLVQ